MNEAESDLFSASALPGRIANDQVEVTTKRQAVFKEIALHDHRRFNGIVLRPHKRGKERSLSDLFLELIDIHGLQLLEEREIQAKRCYPARLGVAVNAPYLRRSEERRVGKECRSR